MVLSCQLQLYSHHYGCLNSCLPLLITSDSLNTCLYQAFFIAHPGCRCYLFSWSYPCHLLFGSQKSLWDLAMTFHDYPLWWYLPINFPLTPSIFYTLITCSPVQTQLAVLKKLCHIVYIFLHFQHSLHNYLSPYSLQKMFLLTMPCEGGGYIFYSSLNPKTLWFIFLVVICLCSLSMYWNILPC